MRLTKLLGSNPSRHIVPPNFTKPYVSSELSWSRKFDTSARKIFLHQLNSLRMSGSCWWILTTSACRNIRQPGCRPPKENPSLRSVMPIATSLSIALSQSIPTLHVPPKIDKTVSITRQSNSCVQAWMCTPFSHERIGPTERVELSFSIKLRKLTSHGGVFPYGSLISMEQGQNGSRGMVRKSSRVGEKQILSWTRSYWLIGELHTVSTEIPASKNGPRTPSFSIRT